MCFYLTNYRWFLRFKLADLTLMLCFILCVPRINGHLPMMWGQYCYLSKACLEVNLVFPFSVYGGWWFNFWLLRSFLFVWCRTKHQLTSKHSSSTTLEQSTRFVVVTLDVMIYVNGALLGVWITNYLIWHLVIVAEYRKMVEKLYKPPSAAA